MDARESSDSIVLPCNIDALTNNVLALVLVSGKSADLEEDVLPVKALRHGKISPPLHNLQPQLDTT